MLQRYLYGIKRCRGWPSYGESYIVSINTSMLSNASGLVRRTSQFLITNTHLYLLVVCRWFVVYIQCHSFLYQSVAIFFQLFASPVLSCVQTFALIVVDRLWWRGPSGDRNNGTYTFLLTHQWPYLLDTLYTIVMHF